MNAKTPLVRISGLETAPREGTGLRGIDFSLFPGTVLAILGPPEEDTAVLLRAVLGFGPIVKGEAFVLGRDIAGLDDRSLRRLRGSIGYVFGGGIGLINNMTLAENIELPLTYHSRMDRRERMERVLAVAGELGIGPALDRIPAVASPAQRTRALFARAAVSEPKLMLYDHPTAGAGYLMKREYADIIRRDRRGNGAAAVVATSDVPFALGLADACLVLREGVQIAWGPPEGLKARADLADILDAKAYEIRDILYRRNP